MSSLVIKRVAFHFSVIEIINKHNNVKNITSDERTLITRLGPLVAATGRLCCGGGSAEHHTDIFSAGQSSSAIQAANSAKPLAAAARSAMLRPGRDSHSGQEILCSQAAAVPTMAAGSLQPFDFKRAYIMYSLADLLISSIFSSRTGRPHLFIK